MPNKVVSIPHDEFSFPHRLAVIQKQGRCQVLNLGMAPTPLEYEALNGIIVSLLSEKGREAPINKIFYAVLKFLDQRIRSGREKR
jgi:hypothetical protein